jgi:DNA-directed RNA polymerase subunit L
MATLILKKSQNKNFLDCEFQHFPLTFVNGLRRILVGNYLPIAVLSGTEILTNTTQMPHEMIKHRIQMLPLLVDPSDAETIKNAKVELICNPIPDKDRIITTADFVVEKGPKHLLMTDRDLDTPLVFIKVRKGEEIHLAARVILEKGSHVCTATYKYHVDPERLKIDKENFMKVEGADVREFDNFHYQKSYSVDEHGRPNWIDFSIESLGVIPSKTLLRMACEHLKKMTDEWITEALDNISRESEKNVFSVKLKKGDHTEGALMQEVIYHSGKTGFTCYDILHPLVKEMSLKWVSESSPEEILIDTRKTIHEYCEIVEKSL